MCACMHAGLPGILGSVVAGLASLGMTTNDFFYRDCTTSSPRQCGAYQLGYQVGHRDCWGAQSCSATVACMAVIWAYQLGDQVWGTAHWGAQSWSATASCVVVVRGWLQCGFGMRPPAVLSGAAGWGACAWAQQRAVKGGSSVRSWEAGCAAAGEPALLSPTCGRNTRA